MAALDGEEVCYLTTVGRVSGRPHVIEIWFAHHDGTVYVLSGGGDTSDWVRNLRRQAEVTIAVGGETMAGIARVIDDGAEERLARDLVFAKYQPSYGGDLRHWREAALPIAIDLASA